MDILRPVMEADLLVLDDIGSEKTSEWVEETMNLIVNTRYNERRHTIFTSNYEDTPDDDRTIRTSRSRSASASASIRGCTRCASSSSIDGADYRHAPPNARRRRSADVWKAQGAAARRTLPARAKGPIRAQLKQTASPTGTGKRELGWYGRSKAGIVSRIRHACSGSISTFRSARPSATTATSTAGCSSPALKDRYVAALEHGDPAAPARGRAAADTIFFGGGTPSLLEPAEIARLDRGVPRRVRRRRRRRNHARDQSRNLDRRRGWTGFRAAGVNRVSFGVQSFRDDGAEAARPDPLGRPRARRGREARAAGFDNVSLDLMMWLPQQTPADWRESVEALIDVGPEHASLYLLELYPNAPLKEEMARAGWSLAPDDDAAEMYLWSLARLDGAGYEQYEISNVARPGGRRGTT